ncbi:MAG: endonuclease/exonuclease/phosphatase family protein, partial [Candidatus Cloacimonetes bacterium]|nr:endonuclease/exonuclease/phosphatase family protein [Candidatus Cloacimonadota bacterium]
MLNFTFVNNIFAATNFRVMTYNALFFPSENGAGRLDDFRAVFEEIQPDILLMQEIESSAGADMLLTELNSAGTEYSRANFVAGFGTIYSMLFYKIAIADLTSQDVIDTPRRDIYEYVMTIDGNPIRFYSCHLKASEDCELERFEEVSILRDYLNLLPEGTEFIIVGDMNFYTSTETGYLKFIADEANNIGRAEDLCDEVGNWHNNITYSSVHSQSSRYEQFGGGAGGGLDDKFDFIFGNYGINNGSG